MNTYFVRFKLMDENGITIHFEIEASNPEKAFYKAAKEIEKRGLSADYSFEKVDRLQ